MSAPRYCFSCWGGHTGVDFKIVLVRSRELPQSFIAFLIGKLSRRACHGPVHELCDWRYFHLSMGGLTCGLLRHVSSNPVARDDDVAAHQLWIVNIVCWRTHQCPIKADRRHFPLSEKWLKFTPCSTKLRSLEKYHGNDEPRFPVISWSHAPYLPNL